MCPLFNLVLFAFSPKGPLHADLLRFDDETLCLDDVEEDFADHIGVARAGQFQAGAESRRKVIGN
jgi:hypothetical protein